MYTKLKKAIFAGVCSVAVVSGSVATAETVYTVHFNTAKHALSPQAIATLRDFAEKHGNYCLHLSAHTDTRGSLSYNEALSQRRLGSVAGYLKKLHFTNEIIGGKALGETHLAVQKAGDVRANRRVELRPYKCGAPLPYWLAGLPLIALLNSSTTTTTTTTGSTSGSN